MITCPTCDRPVAIYSTEGVAAELGITRTAAVQRARVRGITGTRLDARTVVYTAADLEAMRDVRVRGRKKVALMLLDYGDDYQRAGAVSDG